jgi:UDP-N-acetylglucosamine 2-epimerase (non-hydrolysing)
MAPLYLQCKESKDIALKVLFTGQHLDLAKEVIDLFNIEIDYMLETEKRGSSLNSKISAYIEATENLLRKHRFDIVLVHGDTISAAAVAIASFYAGVKVGHVEAGLRTYNLQSPWPEEMHRQIISKVAEIHFAPTSITANNLKEERAQGLIIITGNTAIDALRITQLSREKRHSEIYHSIIQELKSNFERMVLVTAHRRENYGNGYEEICNAILELAQSFPSSLFVFPIHLNPIVRDAFKQLSSVSNVRVIEPVNYTDMVGLMSSSYFILTDSGGLQEEAPFLKKPVLVMRDTTERQEALELGTIRLVGAKNKEIFQAAKTLLDNTDEYSGMISRENPYGDGHASIQIVNTLIEYFK